MTEATLQHRRNEVLDPAELSHFKLDKWHLHERLPTKKRLKLACELDSRTEKDFAIAQLERPDCGIANCGRGRTAVDGDEVGMRYLKRLEFLDISFDIHILNVRCIRPQDESREYERWPRAGWAVESH